MSVVTFVALALLGVVMAHWTWTWLGPRPEPRVQAAAQAGGRVEAAIGLFGDAGGVRNGAPPTGIAVRLLGVVAAARGHRGYAVVQLEASDILAAIEGEDVAPGIRLAEVHPNHVILVRNGVRESLAWPQKNAPAGRPAAPQAVK